MWLKRRGSRCFMPINEEMARRLAQLEGVIWDLDNTLYRFEGDFEQLCHVAAAKAVIKGGVAMTHEQAMEVCLQSYDLYGHSYRLFLERYEIDRVQVHFDFHTFIDEKLIRRELELIALFEKTHLRHALVTHASGEWAARALSQIGLKEFFPDEMIISAEAIDFQRKSESRAPFEKALALLGLPPSHVVVVEDLAENLRIPHEIGLATVLVHYGRPPEPMPSHVQLDCNNAAEFLKAVSAYSASG